MKVVVHSRIVHFVRGINVFHHYTRESKRRKNVQQSKAFIFGAPYGGMGGNPNSGIKVKYLENKKSGGKNWFVYAPLH